MLWRTSDTQQWSANSSKAVKCFGHKNIAK